MRPSVLLLPVLLMALGCERSPTGLDVPAGADAPVLPAAGAPEGAHATLVAGDAVGDQSIYELKVALVDQSGRSHGLDTFRGGPVIVTMFYGTCPYACPTLLSDIKALLAAVDPETRARTRVLLVTFDPERDSPEAMRALAAAHQVDRPEWRFARTTPEQTRELAAVLGIRYKTLDNGMINHSSVITILDGDGVIRHRSESLGRLDDQTVRALQRVSRAAGS